MLFELLYVISNTCREDLSKTSNMANAHEKAKELFARIDKLLVDLLNNPELREQPNELLHRNVPDIEASAATYVWAVETGESYSIEALAAYLWLHSYVEYRG